MTRVLPPYLGEMGLGIRHNLAQVEPWLRNGWVQLTRHPAFYPTGSGLYEAEYFTSVDTILKRYRVIASQGGMHLPPLEYGQIHQTYQVDGIVGKIEVGLDNVQKIFLQSQVEIALRALFLDWFHYEDRQITDFDRRMLSFSPTSLGNCEYHLAIALKPSFLPPTFENPPEPIHSHVGVQIRNVRNTVEQPRNSNTAWMLQTAKDIADYLGLDIMVYGHPNGCHIPTDVRTSWDANYQGDHLARELGYLKSCRIMLAPDSGWTDLMAWLGIPTLLEQIKVPFIFEPLRDNFAPRIDLVDRHRPIAEQVNALLSAEGCVLPNPMPIDEASKAVYQGMYARHYIDPGLFPWEP